MDIKELPAPKKKVRRKNSSRASFTDGGGIYFASDQVRKIIKETVLKDRRPPNMLPPGTILAD